MNESFDDQERKFLAGHQAPSAADGFADKVLASMPEIAPAPAQSKGSMGGLAWLMGGALAAGFAALVVGSQGGQVHVGEAHTDARTTLKLGDRATIVAEADTQLNWRIEADGRARIKQKAGNIFYRVEPGGSFEVVTPRGVVRVVGTSFRVEVDHVKTSKAALLGVVAGAATATVVVVSVYEGKVVSAAGSEQVTLEAGQAVVWDDRGPTKRAAVVSAVQPKVAEGRAVRPRSAAQVPSGASATELSALPEPVQKEIKRLREDSEALADQVERLEDELKDAKKDPNRTHDLDQKTLEALADRCELRWDYPSLNAKAPTMRTKDAEALEFSADEQAVVDKAVAQSHGAIAAAITKAYVAVTGDDRTGSMAYQAMFAEIMDKTSSQEKRRIFQLLSAERAGRVDSAVPVQPSSPVEELMRVMTRSGDRLEGSIAQELGTEAARRTRDLHGGWNSKSRSSHGCPK